MRILIVLTLGILSLVGLFLGIRMIWAAVHPSSAPAPLPMPEWLTARARQWLLLLAIVLLVIPILIDLASTRQDPGEHQPPPPLSSTVIAPKR
ncbi:MAG: hypothetical protein G8237_04500 [Magnetococcales bacterium]|nr:hypothetical protein [Magnetococcales bacterium]NGZ05595.1 hypothetical protein [Magnetococcales bacterium]